jgi:DNA repair protein Swi5/Sae3
MASENDATHQPSRVGPPASSDRQSRSSPGPQSQPVEDVVGSHSDPPEPKVPTNPRLEAIEAKKANLESTLASLKTQRAALVAEAKLSSGLAMPNSWSDEERTKAALSTADATIKEHIALLQKYNEIKDIGQGLMGMIADSRGVRIATVMEEYGMDEKD